LLGGRLAKLNRVIQIAHAPLTPCSLRAPKRPKNVTRSAYGSNDDV